MQGMISVVFVTIQGHIAFLFQDPFNLNVKKGVPGTLDAPTLVPSMYEERIIGCVCKFCVV